MRRLNRRKILQTLGGAALATRFTLPLRAVVGNPCGVGYVLKHEEEAFLDQLQRVATRAHKLFCLEMKGYYSDDFWGITASDYVGKPAVGHGYTAWGGPPAKGPIDGTVVPCAAAGSLPFLPKRCCEGPEERSFHDEVTI